MIVSRIWHTSAEVTRVVTRFLSKEGRPLTCFITTMKWYAGRWSHDYGQSCDGSVVNMVKLRQIPVLSCWTKVTSCRRCSWDTIIWHNHVTLTEWDRLSLDIRSAWDSAMFAYLSKFLPLALTNIVGRACQCENELHAKKAQLGWVAFVLTGLGMQSWTAPICRFLNLGFSHWSSSVRELSRPLISW